MSGREQWYADAYGQLLATDHGLKLIVRQFDGCVRYLVVRTAPEGGRYGDIMLASGTELNVSAAMTAARRRASSIEPILAKRHSIIDSDRMDERISRTSDGATDG